MFNGRSIEFFEGDNRRLSMPRLGYILALYISSLFIFTLEDDNAKVGALYAFLSAFVLGYLGGKTADIFMKDKPQQEITETTTRTVSKAPAESDISAKDVTVKAEGDVSIKANEDHKRINRRKR